MGETSGMVRQQRDRWWLVGLVYTVITVGMAYPLSLHPHSHLLNYDSDAKLIQWIVAWDIHAFVTQPLHLFDANIFAPLPNTLAYAEHLIGSAILAAPIVWLSDNYFLAINLIALASIPLSGLGAYLLARRVGASAPAAFLAGLIFAFAAPRFFRLGQLQLTTVQWMPFCLAWVHQYLDDGQPKHLRLALWMFSLQALSGGHGAVFLTISVGGLLLYRAALGEPLRPVQRLRDAGVIGLLALVPIVLIFVPYMQARADAGLVRTLAGWRTPLASFFASPSHLHQWIAQWFPAAMRDNPEAFLFPGYLPLLLPLVGVMMWMFRPRVGPPALRPLRHNAAVYYTLLVLTCGWLLLGPPYGVWQWVYDWPLLNFIRVPTRFSLVLMLALAVLAALGYDVMSQRWSAARRQAGAVVLGLVLIAEFAAAPLATQDFRHQLPAIDRWLATQPGTFTIAEGPMPRDREDYGLQNSRNAAFMLHSMAHWQKTVHGFSGVLPDEHQRLYEAMSVFPSQEALDRMRGFGVTYVVYHADMNNPEVVSAIDAQFAPWTHALELVHTEADGRVYRIKS
jgi:hypothetical protein